MNEPTAKKSVPTLAIVLVVLGVAALAIIFTVLATIGDDVPSQLAPAAEKARGE